MCDIRIAAQGAKLASSFIKMGIVPGDGGAYLLPRAVGLASAAEMMFTGDIAERRRSAGLRPGVARGAGRCADGRGARARANASPPTRRRRCALVKRLLREAQHARLAEVLELSAAFQALAHETQDHAEALGRLLRQTHARVHEGLLMTDKILSHKTGAIAHVVFNNPDKLNAISLEMWQGLGDAVEALRGRSQRFG